MRSTDGQTTTTAQRIAECEESLHRTMRHIGVAEFHLQHVAVRGWAGTSSTLDELKRSLDERKVDKEAASAARVEAILHKLYEDAASMRALLAHLRELEKMEFERDLIAEMLRDCED